MLGLGGRCWEWQNTIMGAGGDGASTGHRPLTWRFAAPVLLVGIALLWGAA